MHDNIVFIIRVPDGDQQLLAERRDVDDSCVGGRCQPLHISESRTGQLTGSLSVQLSGRGFNPSMHLLSSP